MLLLLLMLLLRMLLLLAANNADQEMSASISVCGSAIVPFGMLF